ncbi:MULTISPECIES: ABC transporter ATP-binding protein [Streptococcus]|uniref:ABC transporter ATP-binding protein n=1 Tax=Streptococcus sp. UMB0029 TaxID=2069308 RepID=UPI000C80D083|nr:MULTISPECIES: ABC transporter ATP-binding protein [Streptococcus]MDK7322212.1 ABC transporter ATP-binding protein [Streptococcus mitis]PMC00578.1 ABC transporter ATP-binding protein [Streptococcus sp. UMB0029]
MLTIHNLSKKFAGNDFYSLRNVNLEINKGEIVGLIGKNGAGKSTLMKLIAKSLKPTEGEIYYNEVELSSKDCLLQDVGIMIDPVFYPEMTVEDNLKFYLRLHNKKELFTNIESTLRLVELWEVRKRKPKNFSFGMKQRTALAIALVAEPNFLILDEPFVGLDPIGVQKLIVILKEWASQRKISMLISSHQLSELESLCDRYVYIESGCLADEFSKPSGRDVLIELIDDENISILESYLSDTVYIENQYLVISSQCSRGELNKVLQFLGEKQMISSISMKENQLKNIFMER